MISKLYPLIVHLPIIIILSLFYKYPWHISFISVLTGYLCCQVPRWIGSLAGAAIGSKIADHLFYIAAVFVSYYLLKKYVISSVRQLMVKSPKSCLLLGGVPFFYYIFDYVTTIYTDVLFSGAEWAVQFMPSTVSIYYFVFVILYYVETQKQADFQKERDMLDTQLRQAQREFESLKQLQQNAAACRHDMRYHLALLQGLASKAKQAEITLEIDVKLPDFLAFSDTELCSLLSNAMENAIRAAQGINDSSKRYIKLRMYSRNNKLCIDLRNSYQAEPIFHQGLPVSKEQGHGYGTKSMAHIIEKHGGVYQFSAKDGWFIF